MCPCLHPDFIETFVKVVGERGRNKCILRKTAVRFSGPVAFEYTTVGRSSHTGLVLECRG